MFCMSIFCIDSWTFVGYSDIRAQLYLMRTIYVACANVGPEIRIEQGWKNEEIFLGDLERSKWCILDDESLQV